MSIGSLPYSTGSQPNNIVDSANGILWTPQLDLFSADRSKGSQAFWVYAVDNGGAISSEFALVNILVEAVNNAPVLVNGFSLNASEGGTTQFSLSTINVIDEDDTKQELFFQVTSAPKYGELVYPQVTGTSVLGNVHTISDPSFGTLQYRHFGAESPTRDSFNFIIRDGGEDGAAEIRATVNISISLVDDPTQVLNFNTAGVGSYELGSAPIQLHQGGSIEIVDPDNYGFGGNYIIAESRSIFGEPGSSLADKFTFEGPGISVVDRNDGSGQSVVLADGRIVATFSTSSNEKILVSLLNTATSDVVGRLISALSFYTIETNQELVGNRGLSVGIFPSQFAPSNFTFTLDVVRSRLQLPSFVSPLLDASGDKGANPLGTPGPMASDSDGNLYVVDTENQSLFRVSPLGIGTQMLSRSDMAIGDARLDIVDITIDSSDNIYLVFANENRVIRVSPEGVITTLIDETAAGSDSKLLRPHSVVIDSRGRAYVSGKDSDNVWRIDSTGEIINVLETTQPGLPHYLEAPGDLVVDSQDLVLVIGEDSRKVFRILPQTNEFDSALFPWPRLLLDAEFDHTGTVTFPGPTKIVLFANDKPSILRGQAKTVFADIDIDEDFANDFDQEYASSQRLYGADSAELIADIALDSQDNMYFLSWGSGSILRRDVRGNFDVLVEGNSNLNGLQGPRPVLHIDKNDNLFYTQPVKKEVTRVELSSATRFNDLPTIASSSGLAAVIDEDAFAEISFAKLLELSSAVDTDGTIAGFKVHGLAQGSALEISGTPFVSNSNDVIGPSLSARWFPPPDSNDSSGTGLANGHTAFSITPIDNQAGVGLASATVYVRVNPINDAPFTVQSNDLTVAFAAAVDIDRNSIDIGDVDDEAADITIEITRVPEHGVLSLSGSPGSPIIGTRIPLDQLFSGGNTVSSLRYSHSGASVITQDSFEYVLRDGGEDGVVPSTHTVRIKILIGQQTRPLPIIPNTPLNISSVLNAFGTNDGNPLSRPSALVADSNGDVYVAGGASNNIFKIAQDGVVSSVVASGVSWELTNIGALAIDSFGVLYSSSLDTERVFTITLDNEIFHIMDRDSVDSSFDSGPFLPVILEAGPNDELFVAGNDKFYDAIRTAVGEVIQASPVSNYRVSGAHFDSAGNLLIADSETDSVFLLDRNRLESPPIRLLDTSGDGMGKPISGLRGLTVDPSGNIYVVGHDTNNVLRIGTDGSISEIIDSNGDSLNTLLGPSSIASDLSGNVYVAGLDSNNVFQITPGGTITEVLNGNGDGLNQLVEPTLIEADSFANVYVADSVSNRVFKLEFNDANGNDALAAFSGFATPVAQTRQNQSVILSFSDLLSQTNAASISNNIVGFKLRAIAPGSSITLGGRPFSAGPLANDIIDSANGIVWTPEQALVSPASVGGAPALYLHAIDDKGAISSEIFVVRIIIESANFGPVLEDSLERQMREGVTISFNHPNVTDVDDSQSELFFRVTTLPEHGELIYEQTTASVPVLGNEHALSDSRFRLSYRHSGTESPLQDSFDFVIRDGGEDGAAEIQGTMLLVIEPRDDIPEIVNFNSTGLPTYLLASAPLTLHQGGEIQVLDPDSPNFDGHTIFATSLVLTGASSSLEKDKYTLIGDGISILVDDADSTQSSVFVDGVRVGSFSHDRFEEIRIDLNANASPGIVGRLLSAISFYTTEISPSLEGSRQIEVGITVPDGPTQSLLIRLEVERRRLVIPSNALTLLDASGDKAANGLGTPGPMAVDSAGTLYVVDTDSQSLFRNTPDGTSSLVANQSDIALAAGSMRITDITIDNSDNIFLAISGENRVIRISPAGVLTTIIDESAGGGASKLQGPHSVVVDSTGRVYVSGLDSDNVWRIDTSGTIVKVLETEFGYPHPLDGPGDMVVDSNDLVLLIGTEIKKVFRIFPATDEFTLAGFPWSRVLNDRSHTSSGPGASKIVLFSNNKPSILRGGDLMVDADIDVDEDFQNDFDHQDYISAAELYGDGSGELIADIAIDSQDNMYALAWGSGSIYRRSSAGEIDILVAGRANLDGLSAARPLLLIDDNDRLFYTDPQNKTVVTLELSTTTAPSSASFGAATSISSQGGAGGGSTGGDTGGSTGGSSGGTNGGDTGAPAGEDIKEIVDDFENTGVLSNITINPGASVKGGVLSGEINNSGSIADVTLAPAANIIGGVLSGSITGNPESPARIKATLNNGTRLSNVVLDKEAILSLGVELGANVKFEDLSNLPAGLVFSGALNPKPWGSNSRLNVVDLNSNLQESGGTNLLSGIEQSIGLSGLNQQTAQDSEEGKVQLSDSEVTITLLPTSVVQAVSGETPRTEVDSDGNVVVFTQTHQKITSFPLIGNQAALENNLGTTLSLGFDNSANLVVSGFDTGTKVVARPDVVAVVAGEDATPGIRQFSNSELPGVNSVSLTFTDANGRLKTQAIVPVPHNWPALKSLLATIDGVSEIQISEKGVISIKIFGTVIRALADFFTVGGGGGSTESITVSASAIPDVNGDGIVDYSLRFSTGEQQILYILPEKN